MTRTLAIPAAAAILILFAGVQHAAGQTTDPRDSAAVALVIEQFHGALAAGDSAAVLRLLHDDALILESGDLETKEQYRSHHLPADIAFARAVPRESGPIRVTVRGDVAWASSTGLARGRFRDRDVNSQTAELVVLERSGEEWVIRAIHWSSRAVRAGGAGN
jgi:ketosteroid isomerase-like protein